MNNTETIRKEKSVMFNKLFKTAAWSTTLRLLIVSLLCRGTLTCSTQLPMSSNLSTGQPTINQPSGPSTSPQPTKNRGSLALKYHKFWHLLSFVWSCISALKSEASCINNSIFKQSLAMSEPPIEATRSTINSIRNRSAMPALACDTDPMHHTMPLRIEPSAHTSSSNVPAATHATALFTIQPCFSYRQLLVSGIYPYLYGTRYNLAWYRYCYPFITLKVQTEN